MKDAPPGPSSADPLAPFREAKTFDELREKLEELHVARLAKIEEIRAKALETYTDEPQKLASVMEQIEQRAARFEASHRELMRLVNKGDESGLTPASVVDAFRQTMH